MDKIEIDGSAGGGQLLRTALSLSLRTGTAFTMHGIRAKRSRPGLMRQHLTAVAAATEIGHATVDGAVAGATSLSFVPGKVAAGTYRFSIGTAGSSTLVLQTILPALWSAGGASEVVLEGGTHNPMAPCADFIASTFLPALSRVGVQATLSLERHGFYPAGGGRIVAHVAPCAALSSVAFPDDVASPPVITATALISALSPEIGLRELKVVGRHFGLDASALQMLQVPHAVGPGNALVIRVQRGDHVETFTGFGERGVSAEQVAERLVAQVRAYLASGAPIGTHLADQLLIPLALAGGGSFVTMAPTDHFTSNAALIARFLPVTITCEPIDAARWQVRVVASS